MKPDSALQKLALFLVTAFFVGLYTWLLIDTLGADNPFEPRRMLTVVTPILSGALGLVLALSLGVDPTLRELSGFGARLRGLLAVPGLLRLGAVTYLLAGCAGLVVWGIKGDVTPDLVTAVALTVVGYLAATMTAIARQ